jgi:hypothetical protein
MKLISDILVIMNGRRTNAFHGIILSSVSCDWYQFQIFHTSWPYRVKGADEGTKDQNEPIRMEKELNCEIGTD